MGLLGLLALAGACPSCPAGPPAGPEEIPGPLVTGPVEEVASHSFTALIHPTPFLSHDIESESFKVLDSQLLPLTRVME